ncbi:glutaminase [Pseudosulfitobacter sp. DSM 107133]|uniref:glutaminase n=1 Tax=Pseudosulfitobacter sp. DSM 107133 TaxID=2883100 RepID=UPI000DF1B90B|nr:glutaminase [Pseudosulfitobacter sp. DSM 107133]UOA27722.1 Thermolabile glutaminase [Pseudosulfitobacter sp. DSM 107133]
MSDLPSVLQRLDSDARADADWGQVAQYIPQLAQVDPAQFAISVALADGSLHEAGACEVPFSVQSITKVFTLAIALGRSGDQLWTRVGREPSGRAFNSIVQLEQEAGRPRNPFINAGAIVTTDEVLGARAPREALAEIIRFVRTAAGSDDIHINEAVAASETAYGHRNFALAHFLAAHDNLRNTPEKALGTYFHHCALEMTTSQLAMAGRFLLDAPGMPHLVSPRRIRRLNALMLTCGHYDGSGDFAYRVGIPGKSGVGGGILAIVPGQASIAVWSPGLNRYGNSHKGTEALAKLTSEMDWSIF